MKPAETKRQTHRSSTALPRPRPGRGWNLSGNPVSQLGGSLAGAVFQPTPGIIPRVPRIWTLGKLAFREEESLEESPAHLVMGRDNGGFLIHLYEHLSAKPRGWDEEMKHIQDLSLGCYQFKGASTQIMNNKELKGMRVTCTCSGR